MNCKNYDINKVRAIPILDVAKDLGIKVEKRGVRYFAPCQWHADNNPSLVIRDDKTNHCHCFACEKSWDAISLIEQCEGVDFRGACEWLEGKGYLLAEVKSEKLRVKSAGRVAKSEERRVKNSIKRTQSQASLSYAERENFRPKIKNLSLTASLEIFPLSYLQDRMTTDNSFVRCLTEVFGQDKAVDVVGEYGLCSVENQYGVPHVGFPIIDGKGRVLDIKVQAYDCDRQSERFFHCNKKVCFWLKTCLKRKGTDVLINSEEPVKSCCLFGEHLLNRYPDRTVVLVESPKNACVGYAYKPEYVWVATGNKGMLKREVLEVLRNRRVAVFPDNDAFDEWNAKLKTMQDIALFECFHTPGWQPSAEPNKRDIADWILGS